MELTDKEILDTEIGGRLIRDFSAIEFLGWVSSKMNGLATYTAANQELRLAVANPPMGRLMSDLEKCRIVRKLLTLNVTL